MFRKKDKDKRHPFERYADIVNQRLAIIHKRIWDNVNRLDAHAEHFRLLEQDMINRINHLQSQIDALREEADSE